jgi:hypothetical protein
MIWWIFFLSNLFEVDSSLSLWYSACLPVCLSEQLEFDHRKIWFNSQNFLVFFREDVGCIRKVAEPKMKSCRDSKFWCPLVHVRRTTSQPVCLLIKFVILQFRISMNVCKEMVWCTLYTGSSDSRTPLESKSSNSERDKNVYWGSEVHAVPPPGN